MRRRVSRRGVLLAVIVAGCIVVAATSVGLAVVRANSSAPPPGVRVVSGASLVPKRQAVAAPAAQVTPPTQGSGIRINRLQVTKRASLLSTTAPRLLYINAIPDKTFRRLAVAPLSNPNATRALADFKCDRVYFAAGNGLCLTATGPFGSHYVLKIFDSSFKVRKQLTVVGIPSRTRISADGRLAAFTTFVNGDSYSPGKFSTRTSIIAMSDGETVANLEEFKVTRDGRRFYNRNFNFWGVTFERDNDHFYATLGSGSQTFLVRGSIRARTMRVVYTHLECPSLSPDGKRIAFKRSLNSHGSWRIYVLDLKTMRAHPLAETQSVDDQVEWRDNGHVLYQRGMDLWVVRADGRGTPSRAVTEGWSPVVVR
jgi:hypothetical protein